MKNFGENLTLIEKEGQDLPPEARYHQWIDAYFDRKLQQVETIPENERQIEEIGSYAYRMKIKEIPGIPPDPDLDTEPRWRGINRTRKEEYFFDFDDTLFDTTGYHKAIWERLGKQLGMAYEEVVNLYESSKVKNEKTGQKMYSQALFVKKLKDLFPEKTEEIDEAFNIDPSDFVNKDMGHLTKLLTAYQLSRIHILTYGNIEVQRPKVEAVLKHYGVPLDILYTQVPKADFLRQYLPAQYTYISQGENNIQNFIIIDDSVSELKELKKLSKEIPFFVPIRLRKPEAKKSKEEQNMEEPAYEVVNRFEFDLANIANSIKHFRRWGSITQEEWFSEDITKKMMEQAEYLRKEPSSRKTEIREGKDGTLIISFIIDYGYGEKSVMREVELSFDITSNEILEVIRDADGNVVDRMPYRPFYLSAVR